MSARESSERGSADPLAALDAACNRSCPEYADLKRAIERYKASGQKYVSSDY